MSPRDKHTRPKGAEISNGLGHENTEGYVTPNQQKTSGVTLDTGEDADTEAGARPMQTGAVACGCPTNAGAPGPPDGTRDARTARCTTATRQRARCPHPAAGCGSRDAPTPRNETTEPARQRACTAEEAGCHGPRRAPAAQPDVVGPPSGRRLPSWGHGPGSHPVLPLSGGVTQAI